MAFRRWFPLSLQEQAAFYRNFTQVFAVIAPTLGFSAEDIEKLEADNAVMQYLAQTERSLKTFKKSFQALRDGLTKGKGIINPDYTHFTPPPEPPIVPYGMFDRLFRLSDRVTTANGYTKTAGAQLGILPKPSESLKPEDLELKLKAKPLGEAKAEIRFVRGKTSGISLYIRRSDNQHLTELGRFFHSPAIVKIPLPDGKPEQIYLCGRYLVGNDAVGIYSPMIELIVAP